MDEKREQLELRSDGKLPSILVEARTLAEGWHKAMVACYTLGARTETPKHREGDSLGWDADINVRISNPDEEPKLHKKFLADTAEGTMQYILEVTHGIHNNWKKNPEDLKDVHWGYTYNERFVQQIPFILARIKHDWEKKGRITGRDYQFTTWRAEEDIIIEQEDPPCLQRGHLRFLQNSEGVVVLNYVTDWRSRCLAKAWLSNDWAQIELMKLFRDRVSDMLGIPIKLGTYTDKSSSLHIYGKYVPEGIVRMLEEMKSKPFEEFAMSLEDYLGDRKELRRIVAAQTDASERGLGKNLPSYMLKQYGYNLETFPYLAEWDTWPKSWDIEPDPSLLK